MRTAYLTFVIALLLCTRAALSDEKKTWELANGAWTPVKTTTTAPADDPTLDRAEQLLFQGDHKPAWKMLRQWEKENKHSPARDRCIYLMAEACYQQNDRIKAFYFLDELMDEYPESTLFYPSLEKQFQIADAFVGGYKRTFLWFAILDASEEGIEMLYRIQQRSPGSPLAERALLRTADYYFSDQQYDLSQDAYTAYARSYPRSPEVPRVKLRAAFSSLAQFRGVKFDPTSIIDARTQLVDIEKNYPQLAADENVASVIEQIDSAFAKKILDTAQFYERTNEIKGAVYQYRFLTETYPNAPEAAIARARLAKIPAANLNDPLPPPASGYAPATEPTADVH